MSYSQIGQDISIIKFYNGLREGFFVDIGATNGIALSNTYLLEKNYDWKGICVEIIPSTYKKLVENRKVYCCDRAVYNATDKKVEFAIAENQDLSGIVECLDKYKAVVDKNKEIITVNTITLTDLLDKYNAPSFIHYLSLDTEGSELEILKAFDFDRYTFGRIDVEHNFVEPRRTLIRKLLTKHGYTYMCANEQDDCFCFTLPSHSHKSTKSSVQSFLRLRGH